MRLMGGLRKKMPITSITMLIGALAIAGIPPLSGFWSKDEVLSSVYHAGSFDATFTLLWVMGVATAFLTAFYMFRMWFMTFVGSPRSEYHAHESPKLMTVPLMILTGLALTSGAALFIGEGFRAFMDKSLTGPGVGMVLEGAEESLSGIALDVLTSPFTYLVLGLVVIGILVAYRIYYMPGFNRAVFARGALGTLQRALDNRWYISKFYDDFAYKVVYGLAKVSDLFDRYVIDGVVNGIAYIGANTGGVIRKAQSGNVQRYASIIIIGIVVLIFIVLFVLPWGGL